MALLALAVLFGSGYSAGASDWHGSLALAESNAEFAVELYRTSSAGQGNVAVAPLSVSTTLAMIYAGARGETEAEMARVLRFELEQPALHAAFARLQQTLDSRAMTGVLELTSANGLWLRRGFDLLPDYVSLLSTSYGSEVRRADFAHSYSTARDSINSWIASETHGRIRDVIAPAPPPGGPLVLILVNAVYFKGLWQNQFQAKYTAPGRFRPELGQSVEADFMNRTSRYRYFEDELAQVLELPYVGDELSMLIALPRDGTSLHDLERALSRGRIDGWADSLAGQEVVVSLPRFTIEFGLDLLSKLSAMGMPSLFEYGRADLSGMCTNPELFISRADHHVFLDVNEMGTEAAAATIAYGTLGASWGEPVRFVADHPFLFVVRDDETGSILFLGRVANPAEQSN